MPTINNSTQRKNKIIGVSAVSVIALVLITVIVLVSVLSGGATVSQNGNLMRDYKISRKASKVTEEASENYINFCTKILTKQVENGGNTAMSLTDTANTLSFLASASLGNTRKQIENLLCQSAEDTAAMMACIEKRTQFNANKNYGIMSSNNAWLNTVVPVQIKKSFLKTNAQRYGVNINRESFGELSTSNLARETVVEATDGSAFCDVQFAKDDSFNVVSGATFKSLWQNGASTDDAYESVFTSEFGDCVATYFKTVESKYISGESFVGTTKEYKDGFTFLGIVPREIDEYTYYTLQDVATEIDDKNLLGGLLDSSTNAKVNVTLPYYVNSVNNPTCIEFSKTLKSLGVTALFKTSASLTEMAKESGSLHLDNYYLSGDISITPAGAINNYSDTKITKKQLEDCNVSVNFTRSFMYFIYDNETKLPIYFGVVNTIE